MIQKIYLSLKGQHFDQIKTDCYSYAPASDFNLSEKSKHDFSELRMLWDDMEQDKYYISRHDDCYRNRKFTNFSFCPVSGEIHPLQHEDYVQSKKMNAVVGGVERNFGDITSDIYENKFFKELILLDSQYFPNRDIYMSHEWQCQVHMIRIYVAPYKTTDVTPEGVHSDGYPFAGVHFIGKNNISGAESHIYNWDHKPLASVNYEMPLDTTFLVDKKMKHYVTPMASIGSNYGHRDILAISFSIKGTEHQTLV